MFSPIREKVKLSKAVDQFADEMKARLFQMADRKKQGWDSDYPIENLTDELFLDAKQLDPDQPLKAVDIANRAMMLWFRKWGKK